jgi:hypothetical protein
MFSFFFKRSLSFIFKRSALSDLKIIQGLSSPAQDQIAAEVATFINLANKFSNQEWLGRFLYAAQQDRYNALAAGATSVEDSQWAAAALSESWCTAKLGALNGRISAGTSKVIMEAIEKFAFRHPQQRSDHGNHQICPDGVSISSASAPNISEPSRLPTRKRLSKKRLSGLRYRPRCRTA